MAELSYPQQGQIIGDANQAPYSADNFALFFLANMSGFGRRQDYGPVKGYDDNTHYGLEVNQTTVASTNVLLRIGAALVRGTVYENDSDLTLAVGANASGNPRIDTVVLRKDYVLQTVRAAVLQGSPAASPSPPSMTQTATTWEIPIADIAVANGFSTLTDSNISPRQLWVNVGAGTYIDNVLNNSGDTLQDGDVVIWDYSSAKAVTTTTTANHAKVAGVWAGGVATNGRYGRIQTRGFTKVRLSVTNGVVGPTNVSIGAIVVTGYTAKKATVVNFDSTSAIRGTENNGASSANTGFSPIQLGILMQALSVGSGTPFDNYALVFVDVQQQRSPQVTRLTGEAGAATGTFTSGSWAKRVLNTFYSNFITSGVPSNTYVSVSGSVVTLQAGVYYIRASAPAYRVDSHATRLQNTSDGTTAAFGTTEFSNSAADNAQTRSSLEAFVAIPSAKTFELQHQCQTTRATDGLGKSSSFSTTAPYAVMEIMRLGDYQ